MNPRTSLILRYSLLTLMILWGGFTFLKYIGVPLHQEVLMDNSAVQAIQTNCGPSWFCEGIQSVIPTITHTFGRMFLMQNVQSQQSQPSPILWYVIISALVYLVLLGIEFFRNGKPGIRFTLKPLTLIILFIAALWLFFTLLSFGNNDSTPYRYVFSPSTQVYPGADQQTLQVLQQDYNNLKNRGCLTMLTGMTQPGVELGEMHETCIQESFFTRVLSEVLCILYLLFVLLSFGRLLLSFLRLPQRHPLLEMLFSAVLGACGTIVILWSVAVAGWYVQPFGWGLLIVLPLIAWKHSLYWLKSLYKTTWEFDGPWYSGAALLGWLLLSYLVFNFLTVVRPFPIGWDDLGVYLNDPRLLVSYGHFIPRMDAFQWEYMTSLGFLLFGYDSPFGATTSMLINWMAGLLATLSVYIFGRVYFGRSQGIIAALVYYTLPMIGHFSFADMKVDNAVFTLGAVALIAVFAALFPLHHEKGSDTDPHDPYHWKWMVIAGIFAGFGFAMKPTTIMVVMSLTAVIGGVLLQGAAFVGIAFLAMLVFAQQGIFFARDVATWLTGNPHAFSQTEALLFFAIAGIIVTGIAAYLRPAMIKRAVIGIVIFAGTYLVTLVPWVVHNNIVVGNKVPQLLLSVPNYVAPTFVIDKNQIKTATGSNIRALPADLAVDASAPACTNGNAKSEELDRYWGFQQGWWHYVGLPWRSVMNTDSVGYYVTLTFALLLFPLILLLPFFWTKEARWLRWLTWTTIFLTIQWILFGNGVPWYGIGMFLGFAVVLEAFVSRAPDLNNRIAASVFLFLSFVIVFANRFWQFEQQQNLYTYAFGEVSAQAMQERTIPHYQAIADNVKERAASMPNTPYVFRIGTFIPYFIPQNLQIMPVADNQLQLFSCLNQDHNPQLTLKRLKALGFNSIIFDTNTATIEQDPNGTLHQKVQQFLDFANTPGLGLQAAVNDPNGGIVYILLP